MDRSAQNIDRSSECEIMNLKRFKFVFDVSPLEIIDNEEEEDFIHGGGAGGAVSVERGSINQVNLVIHGGGAVGRRRRRRNINQINLVIHAISHGTLFQFWSLKSIQQQLQQLQLNSSSSSSSSSACHDQHHRDHHHVRDDDDDEEMIMIGCQPQGPPKPADIILDGGSVFAAAADDDDDYIMSQLHDVDLLYETEWILNRQQLEEVKRCIIQRISEAKPAAAVLLAKQPKTTVRIRVDLTGIIKRYYANPAAAASAYAKDERYFNTTSAEDIVYFPDPALYDYDVKMMMAMMLMNPGALRSSKEALETKILEEEDLKSSWSWSSSSSCSCSCCLREFRVGVDKIKKMPCSHVFHSCCLNNWLFRNNTCPLCSHELPTLQSRILEANCHINTRGCRCSSSFVF